ncbi:histidine phosphatase [Crepidotus variabilis]|uniref:Histidine phosphatase n=1 Tax=Crepidotus variabilis TaxID=179855 RepID=A0A9P6EDJ9_9AGAR|nr:histidine phosphatase [Crepidotus variabilis]
MTLGASMFFASVGLAISPVHYPPSSTKINDLEFALSGSGAPGVYSSSYTPESQYGVYNWCNMPHVRPKEYRTPPRNYSLEYVEVIQRHHKRTPYASNTFNQEDIDWFCTGSGPTFGATSSKGEGTNGSPVQWQGFVDSNNPWTTTVPPGFKNSDCQFPQITDQGLEDAILHGKDLRGVYAPLLDLPLHIDSDIAAIRVTTNVITSQVASGLAKGLFPASLSENVPVKIQSANFDSLEPKYSCNRASTIRSDITTGSQGDLWKNHLNKAASIFEKLDKVSGFPKDDTGGWHVSFDHYYDNLSAKQCHQKRLPCNLHDSSVCVSQEDANTVYRLGNWEYSYLYRDAQASAEYAALRYGAWVLELRGHLQAKMDGNSKLKYLHNVAHDGSISSLLGFLQIDQMVWPGMGSEVVFELYSSKSAHSSSWFIRVLWSGQPIKTSTPLGTLDMVPLEQFFQYIDSMVGSGNDLFAACYS